MFLQLWRAGPRFWHLLTTEVYKSCGTFCRIYLLSFFGSLHSMKQLILLTMCFFRQTTSSNIQLVYRISRCIDCREKYSLCTCVSEHDVLCACWQCWVMRAASPSREVSQSAYLWPWAYLYLAVAVISLLFTSGFPQTLIHCSFPDSPYTFLHIIVVII